MKFLRKDEFRVLVVAEAARRIRTRVFRLNVFYPGQLVAPQMKLASFIATYVVHEKCEVVFCIMGIFVSECK